MTGEALPKRNKEVKLEERIRSIPNGIDSVDDNTSGELKRRITYENIYYR